MKFIVEIPDTHIEGDRLYRLDFGHEETPEQSIKAILYEHFEFITEFQELEDYPDIKAVKIEELTRKDIHDAEALDIWLENTVRPYEAYLVRKMLGILEPKYEEIYKAFEEGVIPVAKETEFSTGNRDQRTTKKED